MPTVTAYRGMKSPNLSRRGASERLWEVVANGKACDIEEVAKAVKVAGGADVIFVDTVAHVMPGANENTSEDMGKILYNARLLGDLTSSKIILVHHSGKDKSKGSRG